MRNLVAGNGVVITTFDPAAEPMTDAAYKIVEHDGGWAYKLGDVFSETFPSRKAAEAAAVRVAEEQQIPGDDEDISWEDEAGIWHDEKAWGTDRPHAYVVQDGTHPPGGEFTTAIPERGHVVREVGDLALGAYDRGDQYARRGTSVARETVRSGPLVAVLLALGCGFLLGLVLHRKV